MFVLVLCNAHNLAHVSRPLEVAKELARRGHRVDFAGKGAYLRVAREAGFATHQLPYMSLQQLVESTRSQQLDRLFPYAQVREFVEAERALMQQLKPDLVLLDNRPTGRTAADLAGTPTAAIVNVHMSTHKRVPFFSPRNRAGFLPELLLDLGDRVGNAVECFFYDRMVLAGLNRLRREQGLPARYSYAHEAGDLVLFPDVPEFNPVRRLPPNAHYVGPLTWHPALPAPRALAQLDPARPCVYLSLGSAGLCSWLEQLAQLTREGLQFVMASGDVGAAELGQLPAGVYAEPLVNADLLLPRCDLVVCHGGNGTLYQALAHGVPVVGVANHEEQNYGVKRLKQLGLGAGCHVTQLDRLGPQGLAGLIRGALADSALRQRARGFQQRLALWNGPRLAADRIEAHVAAPRGVERVRIAA